MMSLSLTGFTRLEPLNRRYSLRAELLQFGPEMFFKIDHSWNVAAARRQCVHSLKSSFEGGTGFVGSVGLHQDFAFAREPRFLSGRFRSHSLKPGQRAIVVLLLQFDLNRAELKGHQRTEFFYPLIQALQRFFPVSATFSSQTLGALDEKLGARCGRSVDG